MTSKLATRSKTYLGLNRSSPTDPPWWITIVGVVLLGVGLYLQFTGKDGDSVPGSILVAVGLIIIVAVNIVGLRRRWANRKP